MKFAALSLAATAALAASAGPVDAQWVTGHGHHHRGYSVLTPGPHLDYHNGHYHYHDGFYRSAPLYPTYGIGFQLGGVPGLRVNPGIGYTQPWGGSYWNSYYGAPNYYRGYSHGGYRWRW